MKTRTFATVLLLLLGWLVLAAPTWAQRPAQGAWEPQIAIVWPHDGAGNGTSVADAKYVNVTIWPTNAVSCASEEMPPLTWAYDGFSSYLPAANATRQMREINGVRFPTIDYNNIPMPSGVVSRFYIASLVGPNSNVWVHAEDSRTILPEAAQPAAVVEADEAMSTIVAPTPHINIVWPHDGQGNYMPVESAPFVNISVLLLDHLDRTMDIDYIPDLSLAMAEGNKPLVRSKILPTPANHILDGMPYRTWEFNDVPVNAGTQTNFIVMSQIGALSVPWTHATDGRTIFPAPQLPPPCVE